MQIQPTSRRARRAAGRRGAGAARRAPGPGSAPDGSRGRLLSAAAVEFAAHGFAGASVDRIAASARLNKAMIYYHFRSKRALYGEILRDMFGAVGARVRGVAASSATPDQKIRGFIEAIAFEADARPHFPPIWFREVADGGHHLDVATVRQISAIVGMLAAMIDEGVRARRFQPINAFLLHAGIVGPLLLFFASGSLRSRIARAGAKSLALGRQEVIAHVQRVTLGVLRGELGDRRQETGDRRQELGAGS
ncbi:MAG TPA: TetR/AcrR family transcriptional regulator [Vicinamibacterales bacterium]|nr:TetR/AcrR family transcriptional regulator [Vicinamibacterales bacterium]